jgi:hypothetical protein
MANIQVRRAAPEEYEVSVDAAGARTLHHVRVSQAEHARYGSGATPERLVEESFRFLLEREPATSILSRFELSIIERYFPVYAEEIHNRLK